MEVIAIGEMISLASEDKEGEVALLGILIDDSVVQTGNGRTVIRVIKGIQLQQT